MEKNNSKISDIFANSYFRIPDYQRGYAWKKERQLPDLWDDIQDIPMDTSGVFRPHYTGTLSLQKIPDEKLEPGEVKLAKDGANFYDIVDGQQRLTTILILIFELYKKLKDKELLKNFIHDTKKGYVYKFSYGKANSNNNYYLIKEIFEDQNSLPAQKNVYTNNLKEAKEFFAEKLSAISVKEAKLIKTKVLTALKFDTKIIDDDFDVQAVFETMNNRGKPLTILEKLKNRLLFLTSRLADGNNSNLPKVINDSWGAIYEYLGKNEDIMLDEDEFLSAHLTLIRIPSDYSFSTQDAERKVFEMFCNRATQYNLSYTRDQSGDSKKEAKVTDGKIRKYAIDLANYVPLWYDVNFPDMSTEIGMLLFQIQCLNGSKEMKLFLAELLSFRQSDYSGLIECLKKVKIILFRNRLPIPSIKDERTFATGARELHLKENTLRGFNEELDNTLKSTIPIQTLIDGFRWLFSYVRGNIGFHKWGGLKFFLFEYENHIHKSKYSREFQIIRWDLFYNTSIEHIMPKAYETYWQTTMDAYLKDRQFNDDELKRAKNILLNSLGNLTIIRDKKNSSLGNNPWNIKVSAYANGCFSERDISDTASWHPWSAESIFLRGKEMLAYLISYLGCVDIDEQDKETYEQDLLFGYNKYVPVCFRVIAKEVDVSIPDNKFVCDGTL